MLHKLTFSLCVLVPLAGALTACSSEADQDQPAGQSVAMTFSAAEAARASLIYNSNINAGSFAVYGDAQPTSGSGAQPSVVFSGTEVSHNGSEWVYDDIQYWLPSQTYSFVALYPSQAEGLSVNSYQNSSLSFTYNYPTDNYTEATDILVSAHRRIYQKSAEKAASVAFPFSHIMARLDFVVNVSPAIGAGSVTLNSITMTGVAVSGEYNVTPGPITSGTSTYDYSDAAWSVTPADQTTPALFSRETNVTLPDGGTYSQSLFPINTDDADPLLVIPQTVGNDVTVTIKYTVTPQGGTATTKEVSSKLRTITVAANGGTWQAGKSYSYNFTIGTDNLVIFSVPTIRNWNEAEGGNYII